MATHHLPPQSTPFIGRASEVAEIAHVLGDPGCRLLTLVGPGGSGKTRLGLQAATAILDEFADGVHFVGLASLSAPDHMVTAVADVLKVYFDASATPRQQLLSFLQRKQALLVLDNFEHLLEGTTLITDLLDGAPELKILATSREALNLQEEWIRPVAGMHFPASAHVEHIETYSAIRLFVERARRMRTDFSLADDLEAVTRICQLVEGMPLGIELAAAWLKSLPCARIADEIKHNLDFLASPLRNVPDRHRSMRAVFDHSWRLLTAQEQAVFRRLAVFRAGFERDAAEQVAGTSLRILSALVDKSLLKVTTGGRYELHELLRQYTEEQLESAGESADARASHSAYYIDFMARRDADLKGRRQTAALHEISIDFENVRTAWQWVVEHQQYDLIEQPILDCLINFGEMNNQMVVIQAILEQAAAASAPAAGEPPHQVWEQLVVRREWANYHLTTRVDHEVVEAILVHARERRDHEVTAWCLWVLTDYAQLNDNHASCRAFAEESLALRRTLGDDFYIAHALVGLHNAYLRDRKVEPDLECLRESVAIRRRLGETSGLGFSLGFLGRESLYNGSLAEAESYFDQAVALQDAFGKTPVYVALMAHKAALAFWRGEFDLATRLVQAGLDFTQGQDYVYARSLSLIVLSFGVSMAGDYTRARVLCAQDRTGYRFDMFLWIDWGLALANCGSGDDLAADKSLQVTLRTAVNELRSPTFEWLCLPLAGIQAARERDAERAVELLGLTSTAPHALIGWLEKWPLMIDLRSALEAELGAEAYETAWERGKTLTPGNVVADLLGTAPIAQPERDRKAAQRLPDALSEREIEVLRLVSEGLSNAEIAQKLFLTVGTVKVHTRNIYGKLGVSSRTQAVAQAQKLALCDSPHEYHLNTTEPDREYAFGYISLPPPACYAVIALSR